MKVTLLEQWNHYKSIIDTREQKFVDEVLALSKLIPEKLYYISPNGSIQVKDVSKIYYSSGKYFSFNKRPTKVDVQLIKDFSEINYEFSIDNIQTVYTEIHSYGKSSGAIKFSELKKFLSLDEAKIKSEEVLSKIAEDNLKLQNDHSRCGYCRKVFPNNEMVKDTIIGRGRDSFGKACCTKEPMIFCSGNCAGNEQMSREG